LNELKKIHEAIECFDEAIKINPTDFRAYFRKAFALNVKKIR
jgi:tetratricopeptide (TPR) repeat protein